MPRCSVIGCGTDSRKMPPDITLHHLPKIEEKRNAWLDILGVENIDTARKHIFVCSQHFDDSCFNRTMNIVKLRDEALPSHALLPTTLRQRSQKAGSISSLNSETNACMYSEEPKMWYLKACRSCLTTRGHFEKISPQAKRLFCAITGLQLDEGDGFPQYFCAECLVHIKKALQFRRRSRRAHFVLKEIHNVRKQVTQPDVERVDRIKTNLISPYSFWKPENTIFSYKTPDAVDPPIEITPDIEAALKESLNQPVFDIQCNAEAKTITIDIKNEPKNLTCKAENQIPAGELVKLELKTLRSSAILVDIKPDNWREIEKEEEERRKRERQAEIDAALNEINGDDDFDDAPVEDTEVPPEDIDLEDVFKGLKEESVKESDSEPEPELEFEIPEKKETKNAPVRKRKHNRENFWLNKKKVPWFLKYKKQYHIVDILSRTKITYMHFDEQKEVFANLLNNVAFCKALYKCAICLTVYNTVDDLSQHVVYHNKRIKFPHLCKICKDRFETEEDLEAHSSLKHWYKYKCPNCKEMHYTLLSLMKCNRCMKSEEWNQFNLLPVPPQKMYDFPKQWCGEKIDAFKCERCKIYFKTEKKWQLHMDGHEPVLRRAHMECDICHLKLSSHKAMTEHMEHWHMYIYECNTCKKRFDNRMQAELHQSLIHVKKVCRTCKKEFSTEKRFQNHRFVHKIGCNMCEESAPDPDKLLMHQLIAHGYIRLNTVPELNDVRFYCELCNIYFTEEKLLFQHLAMKKHPAADNYENGCKHCCQWFESKEEVAKHECTSYATRYPSGYPKKCPDCDVVCESSWKFRAHIARNHSAQSSELTEQMRLCEICGNVVSWQYYSAHMRKRHGETKEVKPGHMQIPCRFCPLKSASTTHHVSHVIFNHTAKPYRCNLCGTRHLYRAQCRDHILKTHAPVLPYACESCNRNFAHLDFLHEHCLQAHGVNLKKTDKSVYLSKRMFGKVYTYPDMKIDGSLIDLSILERTPVEICYYLDDNNKIIDYKDAFFFDHDVDPSQPTRAPPPPKITKKRTLEEHRRKYQHNKQRKLEKKKEQIKVKIENVESEAVKIESLPDIGDVIENIKEEVCETKQENAESSIENAEMVENAEIEHEDVMGQLIEKDGEYFVLVDGELYSLEEDCIENIKAMGETQTLLIQ